MRIMRRNYYILALFFPYLLPLLLFIIFRFLDLLSSHSDNVIAFYLTFAGVYVIMSGVIAAIPYGLLVFWLLMFKRHKPVEWMARISWWLPVIFALEASALACLFMIVGGQDEWSSTGISGVVYVAVYCLGFGYGYVLLTHGLGYLLTKKGVIRND